MTYFLGLSVGLCFAAAISVKAPAEGAPNGPVRRVPMQNEEGSAPRQEKAAAPEVVICRGVGDMKESDFKGMGAAWERYAAEGVITGTSPLLYRIMPDGKFDSYGEHFENWSKQYLSPPGVKLIPHVFCDSTCCDTCKLPTALKNAMARRKAFFAETVAAALKYGWDGYAMDFEGAMPNKKNASIFFQEWKAELERHTGRSGKPLEMHMWSPSGLDENSIAPDMNAMITMGTYNYRSYSSLIEDGIASNSSWRQARASLLFQMGSVESICPSGFGDAPLKHHKQHSLLEDSEDVPRQTRLKGLERGIDQWCNRVQGNKGDCGIGLITYDMANARLQCEDLVKVANGGHKKGMRSIWLWSGGIIPQHWELGLQHFAAAKNNKNKDQAALLDLSTAACSSMKQRQIFLTELKDHESSCDCHFDGNYCCDGSKRRK
jgi:hypothetical protein